MKKILVIEDDRAILRGLEDFLKKENFDVISSSDGEEGYQIGKQADIDLIILDLILPNKNGEKICRDLRKNGVNVPILMLTGAKKEYADKVQGLELGADDYMTKPFSLEELHARLKVLLRRKVEFDRVAHRASQLSQDIALAREVQQNLFPKKLPSVRGWDFAGICRPAEAVGGDYYDIFEVAPEKIIVALGDVSGKGLGPALLMASLHAVIRNHANMFLENASEFIAELNRYLVSTTAPETFVTLFLGVLDIANGELRYVNCGHLPPILVHHKTHKAERLVEGGLVLGILHKNFYSLKHYTMKEEDVLVIFSDGVTEATNKNKEMFGDLRLLQVLKKSAGLEAFKILEFILESVSRFGTKSVHEDDVSVIVVQRRNRQKNQVKPKRRVDGFSKIQAR